MGQMGSEPVGSKGEGRLSEGCHGNCKGVLRVIKPGKKLHACV